MTAEKKVATGKMPPRDEYYGALVKELSAIAAWERRFDNQPDPEGRKARKMRRQEILRELADISRAGPSGTQV